MPGFAAYLQSLLEEMPQAAYYGQLGQQQMSPLARRYFEGNYGDIYNQYLGRLGQQLMGGQEPTARFQDFLSEAPFSQRFAQLPPEFTGRQSRRSRFNPYTQFKFG